MSCPKILRPIFAFNEKNYSYTFSPDSPPIGDERLTSYFESITERLSPDCKYTRFQGPLIDSTDKVVSLPFGQEVLYTKYTNYLYRIRYLIRGDPATFWKIVTNRLVANLVYDAHGNLLQNLTGEGEAEVYGFYFPIVVEIPKGSYIGLEITGIKLYTNSDFPLATGDHCVAIKKKCITETVLAYSVKTNNSLTGFDRTVASLFAACSENLRENYLAITSGPCTGPTN